jgi:hypothetical protein
MRAFKLGRFEAAADATLALPAQTRRVAFSVDTTHTVSFMKGRTSCRQEHVVELLGAEVHTWVCSMEKSVCVPSNTYARELSVCVCAHARACLHV